MTEWTIDWTITTAESESLVEADADTVALRKDVSRYADVVDGASTKGDQGDLESASAAS